MLPYAKNIPDCILELVLNSLNASATSIAIRVNFKQQKIQVVDNGIGICKCMLKMIGEHSLSRAHTIHTNSLYSGQLSTLLTIQQNCSALFITSKYRNAANTYMKIFRRKFSSTLIKTENRPSYGTTVSVYGFQEIPCNCKSTMSEICTLITNVALTNLKVSFSIRDDYRQKVVLKIGKPHTPLQMFKLLYGSKNLYGPIWYIKDRVGLGIKFSCYILFAELRSQKSRHCILNGRPVSYPFISDFISDVIDGTVQSSSDSQYAQLLKNKTIVLCFITYSLLNVHDIMYGCINNVICYRIHSLIKHFIATYIRSVSMQTQSGLSEIVHKIEKLSINAKCGAYSQLMPSCQHDNEDYISINSEWSEWIYEENNIKSQILDCNFLNHSRGYNRYDFVPRNLQNLLKYANTRLTKTLLPTPNDRKNSIFSKLNEKQTSVVQDNIHNMKVRSCKLRQQLFKLTLRKQSILRTKVLRQVNNQLIAGITVQDNIKLLLMMDQHAVDERIRYENLLQGYRTLDQKRFLSIDLNIPLNIKLSKTACLLLSTKRTLLQNFGLKFTLTNDETLSVHSVPKCLSKTYCPYDNVKLALSVQNLLYEIAKNLENGNIVSNMPFTIHHAIATEACHGAIKFGDALSFEQCAGLVELLRDVKCPNRCAHGRPSIIPIIQLSELANKHYKSNKKPLNFSSLKNIRQLSKKRLSGYRAAKHRSSELREDSTMSNPAGIVIDITNGNECLLKKTVSIAKPNNLKSLATTLKDAQQRVNACLTNIVEKEGTSNVQSMSDSDSDTDEEDPAESSPKKCKTSN